MSPIVQSRVVFYGLPRAWIGAWGLLAVTFFTSLILDWCSLSLGRAPGEVSSIWPGDAAMFLFMLARGGRGAWWRLLAGSLGSIVAGRLLGDSPAVVVSLTAANALDIAILFIAERLLGGFDLRRTGSILRFLAVAAIAGMVSGLAAAIVMRQAWGMPMAGTWLGWSLADWLGYVAIVPPVLVLAARRKGRSADQLSLARSGLVLAGYTAVLVGVFAQAKYPLLFLTTLALFGVAYMAELEGVVVALMITVVVGAAFTVMHRGPSFLVEGTTNTRLIVLQIYLAASTLAFLPISAVLTGRRRLEADLRDARAEAEAASALKSQFLADMNHELRTPLASILGFAGILKNDPRLGDEEREHAECIAVAGSALLTTVNDILAFSELEARRLEIRPTPASAQDIAGEVIRLFQAAASAKGLALTLNVDPATPAAVMIDRGRVRQVLLNLVANAVKFTETGSVAVGVDYDPAAQRLGMSVADTGPGLEADQIPFLFDRFSRADPAKRRRHGGAGLGLAICKGIVEAAGGAIEMTSAPGQGSVARFTIPAAPAGSFVDPAPDIAAALRPKIRRLLLAGRIADPGWAHTILGPLQLEIACVDEAAKARVLVQAQSFDLVLIDADAAALDGAALVRAIRSADCPTRGALVLGVSSDIRAVAALRAAGSDGGLAKPMSPDDLIGLVMSPHRHAATGGHGDAAQPQVGTNVQ